MTQTQLQQPDSSADRTIHPLNFGSILDHIDEFGLTSNQFRVYCHLFRLVRDGVVSESSESIAKVCKLTRVTVLRVLSQLSQMNLIQCARTPGKKSVFYLMPYSHWRILAPQEKKQANTQQSKVVQLRTNDASQPNSATCKPNLPVNEINNQQEVEEPLKGSSTLPAQQLVNEINTSNSDTARLDEKLAAARERGWQDSGKWWNDLGQQMVSVNRFVVSVAEFMGRSLDSFDVGRQVCAEGLRICREQIAKIKRRSHQQREQVVATA